VVAPPGPGARLLESTRYEPAEVEPRVSARWLQSGLFHPDPGAAARERLAVYSIAIPPPNVTGSLHMGHALNNSIQDVLVRYHRMRGALTKWILGTDHAGIATQARVEKMLREEGTSRRELGRAAFERRVWEWREHYGGTIVEQLKRLGASCDYEEERFTLDPAYARAVAEAFVALHRKGWIYRDRYIVNWDPGSRSAISDLEVENRRETDTLYSIAYDLEGGGTMTIATVRPETMLADTAVAVNPDDERYRELVGRTAILPLVGRRLPVIADPYVKLDFGTGQLKVTPAHDPNDFEIGRRHGLDVVSAIGEDGRMTPEAGEPFAGMTVAQAREAVVKALEAEGRIVAAEPYEHEVPYSHRSGERIEPLISLQWFMDMSELAPPAIAAVREGRVRIVPERNRRVYLDWMAEIRPWCISRQLWWGHRLPVHYCDACEGVEVAVSPPARCERCGGELRQEEDVLDTWFSSSLWPFAALGWPEQTDALRAFYPTSTLSTARDILFLWVARMIMMGIELTGEPPFGEVYIHSVIQAPDGRRMSKSLGTGIDPLEQIEAHGADAVRFGLLAMSSSQDVRFSAEKIKQGQALANKLFNAARFVLGAIGGPPATGGEGEGLGAGAVDANGAAAPSAVEDSWIASRLERAKAQQAECVERFDFSHAALALYDFVYGELCDWYIELVKPRLAAEQGPEREALVEHLLRVLRETVAIAHPLMPFVTEELWSGLGGDGLLAGSSYPGARPERVDAQAEEEMARAIEAVVRVRGWRDQAAVTPGRRLAVRLRASGYERTAGAVALLARLDLDGHGEEGAEPIATVAVPGGAIDVLSAAEIDVQELERRRAGARARVESELARARAKLANEGFVRKAPADVVEAERSKLERLERELDAL
jgi:valyl-tRNA synthetase